MTDDRDAGPFTIGSEFAGYRILGVLGRGGMGVVYRAEDTRLGRDVALKVLSPHIAREPAFRERFLREPRLLASIEHRNIVDVFHADQVDGVAFLAMRLIAGVDLGTLLRDRGRLAPPEVVHIVSEVGEALDAAHDRGLVHRDVKPGNILVSPGTGPLAGSRVYLTDFGLTKRNDAPAELTSTGQFLGTVDYVAPEQIQGAAIDGRADLYALACVAYECLAGQPPFRESREAAALMAHLVTPPPDVTRARPELPPAVGAVIVRGMAKSRDERPATCGEFAAELKSALDGTGVTVRGRGAEAAIVDSALAALATPPAASPPPGFGAPGSPFAVDPFDATRTMQLAVPPAPPPRPVAPRLSSPPPYAYDPPDHGRAGGYPYETEFGLGRRDPPGRRRRRGRAGGLVRTGLVLLLLLGAGIGLAIALRDGGFNLPGLPGTGSPGPDATVAGDPAAADRALREQIPRSIRRECRAAALVASAIAVQECPLEGGRIYIRYALFADTETMDAEYARVRAQLGIPPDSGIRQQRCQDPATFPNESDWTLRGEALGRLMCTVAGGPARFEWTDSRTNVLTSAIDASGQASRLYELWQTGRLPAVSAPTAQPVPPESSAPPAPTEAPAPTTEVTPGDPDPTDPPPEETADASGG